MNSKTILAISLIAVFAVAMVFGQSALAKGGDVKDKKNDAAPDFDIKKAGIDKKSGDPFIEVRGTVCGTASDGLLFVYILVTDDGTYVIATHGFVDDDEQGVAPDLTCHAHKVTSVDGGTGCVTTVSFTGETVLVSSNGHKAFVVGTAATAVFAAVTAIVDLGTGQVCPVALDTT